MVTANARSPDPSMSTSTIASSTISAPAQTHTIQVGLADHKFKPEVTEANVGDTVEFRFYPTNHSVVRAEYSFPCIPYEMTGPNKHGFFSGFNAVDKVVHDPPKYSITINDTNPIFFYCSAPGSCIKYGMVGAINPNSSTPVSTQTELARNSSYMLNPGEPFPPEAPLPSNLPSSTAVPIAPVVQKHGLPTGAIAGIVVAAICAVLLCGGLFFCWGRTRTLKDEVERKESSVAQRVSRGDVATSAMASSTTPQPTGLGIYDTQPYHTPHQAQSRQSPMQEQMHYGPLPVPLHQQHEQQYHQPQPQPRDHKPLHLHVPSSPPLHHHPAFSSPTYHTQPSTAYELSPHGSNPYFASPSPTPQASSVTDHKYGPYGMQQRQSTGTPAPPYGWHVNQIGPVEMEGNEPGRIERVRWEEVGARESRVGEGRMF
ncbi:hypothetical protein DE146DRAFT_760433 [Phaeosphaeria sp. MPI-PUGE-AT-0046c]|nr:hypothetical protein DE146DRAFT_760433 [Phaeosphaeria sp. MPI-PUGE-AT-0046c]